MLSGSGNRGAKIHTNCAVVAARIGPRVRQLVLDGQVREAEAVGGSLLRPGDEDRGNDPDLAVRGALGGAGRPSRHALLSQ